jgi:mRNA-degrading endonuclease RelE of RelBE toxin-antitoxin system
MDWNIVVARAAQKQVAKLPAKDQEKIGAVLLAMAKDPFSGDILKLEGEEGRWRRRVGSYRIFFRVDADRKTVWVSAIVRRTSTTY